MSVGGLFLKCRPVICPPTSLLHSAILKAPLLSLVLSHLNASNIYEPLAKQRVYVAVWSVFVAYCCRSSPWQEEEGGTLFCLWALLSAAHLRWAWADKQRTGNIAFHSLAGVQICCPCSSQSAGLVTRTYENIGSLYWGFECWPA